MHKLLAIVSGKGLTFYFLTVAIIMGEIIFLVLTNRIGVEVLLSS